MLSMHGPGKTIPVIDFRRHRMILNWYPQDGTWTACDLPPPLVHGIALIRASRPNVCVFGQNGVLYLQAGADKFVLTQDLLNVRCTRRIASLGLRRWFVVESITGKVLFSHSYWPHRGDDFFRWLAARANDPAWRVEVGRRWSDGTDPTDLRSS